MKKPDKIYAKEWIEIHPYKNLSESDQFYVKLANNLLPITSTLDEQQGTTLAFYVAAYMEDVYSQLGLWHCFSTWCKKQYDEFVPLFNQYCPEYDSQNINLADICFILWSTLQYNSRDKWINPYDPTIFACAESCHALLEEVIDEAPANDKLENYFSENLDSVDAAESKLYWFLTRSYLIAPSTQSLLKDIKYKEELYTLICGPLALLPGEWIKLLTDKWDSWTKLLPLLNEEAPAVSSDMEQKNKANYELFIKGNQGKEIVYIDGYLDLRLFLTQILQWPNDENHTLPHLKDHQNFILMANKDKGILLACDIAQYINDPENPLYDKKIAKRAAFSLLTDQGKCPPDLLVYCIENGYLPDINTHTTKADQDFIARMMLGIYYRGD